jgi:hypothetical protein
MVGWTGPRTADSSRETGQRQVDWSRPVLRALASRDSVGCPTSDAHDPKTATRRQERVTSTGASGAAKLCTAAILGSCMNRVM